jgi:hypothetical protein
VGAVVTGEKKSWIESANDAISLVNYIPVTGGKFTNLTQMRAIRLYERETISSSKLHSTNP